jgi:type II restriction enzyme
MMELEEGHASPLRGLGKNSLIAGETPTVRRDLSATGPSSRSTSKRKDLKLPRASLRVDLALPDPGDVYRSHSQRARVATERWAAENLYCPACPSDELTALRAGTAVVDFTCPSCELGIQLKSKSGHFGRAFANSAYENKVRAIRARTLPDYALMSYDRVAWRISNLSFLPGHFITESVVQKRSPLSPSARRAGWVGSNVLLSGLPPDAFVKVVTAARPVEPTAVRKSYRRFAFLRERGAESAGWITDVLTEVRRLVSEVGPEFTLVDLYASGEGPLAGKHPKNQNVRAKVRQQLQILRARGVLRFVAPGRYRFLADF